MMIRGICLFLFVVTLSFNSFANILDKVQLEELLQKRLENHLARYDKDVRVQVKFIYRTPTPLPGLSLSENEELEPNTVVEGDIRNVSIEIQSRLPEITKQMSDDVYALIPIRKGRIKLKYQPLPESTKEVPPPPPILTKDLWDISKVFSETLSQLFIAIFSVSLLLLGALVLFIHRSSVHSARENFGLLAKTMSETSFSGGGPNENLGSAQNVAGPSAAEMAGEKNIDLTTASLLELFADCYWCEQDTYAHWLWNQLSSSQKRELLQSWPLMRKYSDFFVHGDMQPQTDHMHPYYIAPEALFSYSQDVLQKELKKQPDLWLRLSPLRQKNLEVPIADKLRIVKKREVPPLPQLSSFSKERPLPMFSALGDLSFQDEKAIITQPDLVPVDLREQFASLVWLFLQPKEYIESVLAQYDAPSLASAWIGDVSVLEKLEECLPEKKKKMLQSYNRKISPHKKSKVYQALVKAGLQRESA